MNAESSMRHAEWRRHGSRWLSPLRVVLAGGGTGGHLYPGIAVARCLQARCPGVDIAFLGLRGGLDERVVPREGFRLYTVPVQALKGRARVAQVRALGTLTVGTWQAVRLLQRLHPHLVIGAGGYVMGPGVLAATLLRLPRVIMEQNLIPGLTVRVLARCAHRVFTTFPETQAYLPAGWVEYTGTPIRPEIWANGLTEAARCNGVLHVLVFGGSQGAHRINQAMLEALPFLQKHRQHLRLVHQTGDADFATMVQAYQQAALDVEVSPFLHDMGARYRWAHLVVCRAGASTLAELTACGKPSILVPYPYAADDHQHYNALALQQQGAAQVILDAELTGARLAEALHGVLAHPLRLRQQAERSRALGKPQAADAIVTACLRLLGLM